jgi:uncharacterized protein (TIGR02449 family)
MHPESTVEHIAERVERLLVRYEELQRTNALLAGQVQTMTQERDSLRSRLAAARGRIEALLDRLPEAAAAPESLPSAEQRHAG